MTTKILDRVAADCYCCGRAHQLRLVDRGQPVQGQPSIVVVSSGRTINMPGAIDAFEEFDLAVQAIARATSQRTHCPITPRNPLEG